MKHKRVLEDSPLLTTGIGLCIQKNTLFFFPPGHISSSNERFYLSLVLL